MNLQPIAPERSEPSMAVRVMCSCCYKMHRTTDTKADLDAAPGTYVCVGCEPAYVSDDTVKP